MSIVENIDFYEEGHYYSEIFREAHGKRYIPFHMQQDHPTLVRNMMRAGVWINDFEVDGWVRVK